MFSVTEMRTFEMFSMPHIVFLVLFVIISSFLILFRERLKPLQSLIKWSLFSILVLSEISMQIWLVVTDQWEIGTLPLHLCSVSTIILIYLFLKPSKYAFYFVFFTGFIPPILSMVTPDLFYQFPHYRFLKYFLHHAAISWSVIYFIVFEGYRVPRKAIWTTFLALNVIALPMFFINLLLDTNFFYLANPTETKTILSFFGTGVMYYLNLELAALSVLLITYIPMGLLLRKERGRVYY
ncbi:TIGR02206 family membrane protein [Bacillus sp. PS06]|uniref:YwaF family protein n=1 Tax=Bacillus sp. PS06 TaxID=2764176 RepID=UPI0017808C75|nr:TIGR02206 family membrane protein [Bacillus sp. PS06]MBD8069569.1 TIGR02206 family membrane protein [Bacillus sp. PS06]